MPLLWRIFVGNALVLGVATMALVLTPVTVSFPAAERELLVLAAGLAVMLAVNYVLLRRAVAAVAAAGRGDARGRPAGAGAARSSSRTPPAEVAELAAAFDQMLDRLERERRESARRALGAQEEERLRIARELHDEVGQALTAVLLQLDRAQAGAAGSRRERIAEAREAARATLEEVRAIARNLRPEALDDLGLAAALRQLCIEAERAGVLVERDISSRRALAPRGRGGRLPGGAGGDHERAAPCRRRADRVTLRPAGSRGALLRVVDDGRGCGDAPEGAGMRGMRERARARRRHARVGGRARRRDVGHADGAMRPTRDPARR